MRPTSLHLHSIIGSYNIKMNLISGKFIISLDFEIMWGVRDVATLQNYGENLRGERTVIPRLLDTFSRHNIQATFATVGFLFFENKEELLASLPENKPAYQDANLSPYGNYLQEQVGENYQEDLYHYAWPLIKKINETPGQEIATHTFSHYYCLEKGQEIEHFKDDIQAAMAIAQKRNIQIESIIFPRNQFNEMYLQVCQEAGIIAYRNNEKSWLYTARTTAKETIIRRGLRFIDAYINISGYHDFDIMQSATSLPVNIPSSRFLRPYHPTLKWLEFLRLHRIKKSMTHAAKNNLTYHLWWHPHNFGINQDENFLFLEKILAHYQSLKQQYNFTSCTMGEIAREIIHQHAK